MMIIFAIIAAIVLLILYIINAAGSQERYKQGGNDDLPLRTYKFTRHEDIDVARHDDFCEKARKIIASCGWNNKYKIVEDAANGKIEIMLAPRKWLDDKNFLDKKYDKAGNRIYFSVTVQAILSPPIIYIDDVNWKEGVARSTLPLHEYREYVITHELGHALGYGHQKCNEARSVKGTEAGYANDAQRCPVMYQATRGHDTITPGCKVTKFDYMSRIPLAYVGW